MVGTIQNTIYYNSGYYQVGAKTAISNGDKLGTKGAAISDDDFILVTLRKGNRFRYRMAQLNGSINTHGFMQVKENSSLYSILGAAFQDIDTAAAVATTTTRQRRFNGTAKTETNPAQSSETASATETSRQSPAVCICNGDQAGRISETATATETKPAESRRPQRQRTKPGESTTEVHQSQAHRDPDHRARSQRNCSTGCEPGRRWISRTLSSSTRRSPAQLEQANQRHNSDVYADGRPQATQRHCSGSGKHDQDSACDGVNENRL
ncbi:MAG: hypothetical protein ACLT3Y_04115 [Ruminococcus callidus]